MGHIRRYFISGLLFWLPIWATVLVVKFIIDILHSTFAFMPRAYQPDPFLGLIITLVLILATGILVANLVGKKLVEWWEAVVGRIPLVRTVYTGVKQVLDTLFSPGGQSFRKVLLVEYPREGLWSIAFQTGDGTREITESVGAGDMVSIFIPTTPNPTSGFLMLVPRSKVTELNMSVEQALKYVISLGVVQPLTLSQPTVTYIK